MMTSPEEPFSSTEDEDELALNHELSKQLHSSDFTSGMAGSAAYDNLKPGEQYELRLVKVNNSFGLNVAGGVNTTVKDGGIYVKSFAENGAAEMDKRIHVGDRLLRVNDVTLLGVTHRHAVETLRNAPATSHLVLIRGTPPTAAQPRPPTPTTPTPLTTPSIMDSRLLSGSDTGVLSDTDTPLPADTLSVPGGDTSVPDDTTLIADDDNDEQQQQEEEQDDEEEEDVYSFVNTGNTYSVNVPRSSNGLGFSIIGGVDQHSDPLKCVIRVKKVFPHGPAYEAGLQEGDVILQVNDRTLGHLANKEVLQILRTTQTAARMLICRPGPGALPPIGQVKIDLDSTLDSQTSVPFATSTPSADQMLAEPLTPYSPTADLANMTPIDFNNLHKPLSRSQSQGIELDPPETDSQYTDTDSEYIDDDGDDNNGDVRFANKQNEIIKSAQSAHLVTNSVQIGGGADLSDNDDSDLDELVASNLDLSKIKHDTTGTTTAAAAKNSDVSKPNTGVDVDVDDDSLNSDTSDATLPRDPASRDSATRDPATCETTSRDARAVVITSLRNRTPSPVKSFLHDAGLTSGEPTPSATPAATPSIEHRMNEGPPSSRATVSESIEEGDEDEKDATDCDDVMREFEVTLTKGVKGLGFTVAGGQQTIGLFYVKDVLFNPALSSGMIQRGDRLIGVNGEDMTTKTHVEAVDYLRHTPQTVTLRFLRHDDWEFEIKNEPAEQKSLRKYFQPSTSSTKFNSENKSGQIGKENCQVESGHWDRKIDPLSINDIDKSLIDNKSIINNIDNKSIINKNVKNERLLSNEKPENFMADADWLDALDDEALWANDLDLDQSQPVSPDINKLNVSAGDDLDRASQASSFGNITLPMSDLEDFTPARPPAVPIDLAKQIEKQQNMASGVIRIALQKPADGEGLGFTLIQGEKGLSSALFVRSIAPGGVASQDGRLKVGDKLLQVNGESVIGMPHNKAVTLVKKAHGRLQIAVSRGMSRPPSTVPTPAATPSREIENRATPINNSDTDSDVDSTTLDEDLADGRSTPGWPMSGRASVKTIDTTEDGSTDEHGDTFTEQSLAYKAFMENKVATAKKRGDVTRNGNHVPTASDKASDRFTRVPQPITDQYLTTLELIKPPRDTLHYSGRQLQITCKALRVKVDRDDPVEEYKVS